MRPSLPCLLVFGAASGGAGCSETCPPPTSIAERTWTVFVNPVTWEIDNEEGFPAETSPANGEHEMNVAWPNNDLEGPITVTIDGQVFEGRGRWNDVECGQFSIGFNGRYEAEGNVHAFSASALLVTWESNVDGFLDWQETWQSAEGVVGSYSTQAQLRSVF
jgi:hypothetical protein